MHAWQILQELGSLFVTERTTLCDTPLSIPVIVQHLVDTITVMGFGKTPARATHIALDFLQQAHFSEEELHLAQGFSLPTLPTI